jgi:hypothetical protein
MNYKSTKIQAEEGWCHDMTRTGVGYLLYIAVAFTSRKLEGYIDGTKERFL